MDEGSGRPGLKAGQRGRGSRSPRLSTMAGGGLEFAVAILLGVFAGQWLDRRWGTSPWLVVIGAVTGAGAGFYKLYRDLMASQRRPGADDASDDTER
jgi:F0F1-type ATP synthase assembly protein I